MPTRISDTGMLKPPTPPPAVAPNHRPAKTSKIPRRRPDVHPVIAAIPSADSDDSDEAINETRVSPSNKLVSRAISFMRFMLLT